MTSWLRRNRWGLLALPITAALAIGANAQRLQDYWWDVDLRNADATGSQGEWVAWTDDFTDALGDGTRTFRVKVSRTESTVDSDAMSDVAADLELPPDLAGVRVTMDFEAAPDQVLFGCRMALVDGEGNRYVYRPITNGLRQGMHPCVPEDQPGPVPSISAGEPRTAIYGERPPQWTTQAVVVVPRSATITQVLLWWEQPDYLEVKLD